jgi:hypothetical protein
LKIRATGFAGYPQNQNRPAAISSPGGQRIKGEGGRKTQIKFPHFLLKECMLPATAINRQTCE